MVDCTDDPVVTARFLAYEYHMEGRGIDPDGKRWLDLERAYRLGIDQLIEEARQAGVDDPVRAVRLAAYEGQREAARDAARGRLATTNPLAGVRDEPPDDVPPPDDEDAPWEDGAGAVAWRTRLIMEQNRDGELRVKSCGPNALVFARYHPALFGRLGLNERSVEPVWLDSPPWGGKPRPLRESDADELALWIAGTERIVMSRDHWWHALTTEAERHPFDLVRDWLESIEWDQQERISWWLAHRCGAEASPFVAAASRAWMVSAVARTLQPGVQADHMLVLEGEQGVGKTTVIRELAGAEWYSEVAVSDAKDAILTVHGPWICEWAELSGLQRRDAETVKAFVSRRTDRVRLPYGRRMVDIPRRCVFAGSTNEGTWQTDPTGGRRYWPVKVGRCDVKGIRADREQMWAEAVAAYRAGEQWWLDGEVAREARGEQEARYEGDPWEDRILEAVTTGTLGVRERVSVVDLLQVLDLPSSAQGSGTGRRLARIMKRIGWAPTRWRETDGQTPRGYQRTIPIDTTTGEAQAKVRRLRGI